MSAHQPAYSKQLMAAGQPALDRQSATWSLQCEWPSSQLGLSFQSGRSSEHHLPQPYSHLDGTVTVARQSELVGLLVGVVVVVGGYVVAGEVVDDDDVVVDEVGEAVEVDVLEVEVLEVVELLGGW